MLSSSDIRQAALAEGFSLYGIARARVLEERRGDLQHFFDAGFEGEMGWLRREWERRLDPSFVLPGARTIIVCAVNHKNEAWNQNTVSFRAAAGGVEPTTSRAACANAVCTNVRGAKEEENQPAGEASPCIASYIYARDYHVSVKEMLKGVANRFPSVRMRGVCDTAPILEKAWAVEAGLGWTGKNSLLITPQFGSFVSLGLLVTDAECDEYDSEAANSSPPTTNCGSCTRCIDACPRGAIVAPHVIDPRRCNAYLTLEVDAASEGCSAIASSWIAGCDVCQQVCPHNQRTPLYSNPRFEPLVTAPAPAEFWRTLTRERFDRLLSTTVLARRSFDELRTRINQV